MRMLLLGTFLGLAIAFLYRKLVSYFINKFVATRWYPVLSYNSEPNEDGTFSMDFSIAEGDVHKGYTKKCPPKTVSPDDLVVMVRKYHEGRGLYRVFWKIKE